MKYEIHESLRNLGDANSAYDRIVNERMELLNRYYGTTSNSAVSCSVQQGKRRTEEEPLPMSLYLVLGELVLFERLFGEALDAERKRGVSLLINDFRSLFSELWHTRSGDRSRSALRKYFTDRSRSYHISVEELEEKSQEFPQMSEDDLIVVLDGLYYVEEVRREPARFVAIHDFCGGLEDSVRMLEEITRFDDNVRQIYRNAYDVRPQRLVPQWWGGPEMAYRRYVWPPEIDWLSWYWLELERNQPLKDIFGFDPRKVRKKLGPTFPKNTSPHGERSP